MIEELASTTASYDRIVDDYEHRNEAPSASLVALRNSFAGCVKAPGRVADVGCGPGRDLEQFAADGLRAVGVDASAGMVRRCRERGLRAVLGDLRFPPLRRGFWDGIWSSASLLHVPGCELRPTLDAWHRLLAAGGTLGLTTSMGNGESGWELVPYAAGTSGPPQRLRRWFVHHDRTVLQGELAAAGFTIVTADVRRSSRTWLEVLATRRP